jgi:hypothetical protein
LGKFKLDQSYWPVTAQLIAMQMMASLCSDSPFIQLCLNLLQTALILLMVFKRKEGVSRVPLMLAVFFFHSLNFIGYSLFSRQVSTIELLLLFELLGALFCLFHFLFIAEAGKKATFIEVAYKQMESS